MCYSRGASGHQATLRRSTYRVFFFFGGTAASFKTFLDHTQRRTTVGRTPLDEQSARRRDLYLATHNIYNRQIFMPPERIEPTIPESERPQTYASDRAATGIGANASVERYLSRLVWERNQVGALNGLPISSVLWDLRFPRQWQWNMLSSGMGHWNLLWRWRQKVIPKQYNSTKNKA